MAECTIETERADCRLGFIRHGNGKTECTGRDLFLYGQQRKSIEIDKKPEFSPEENKAIIDAINRANPDLLWIGMTAPKQEKWTYLHWNELNIHCHTGTIGAVFDFFAGTVKRAPLEWQKHSLEWLYRLLKEPKRMWKRYIIGNSLFLLNVMKERKKGK